MKVLLLNPPNLHYARISTGWDFEIGNIGLFPPYGLISLAAYIRQHRPYQVRVLDCIAENMDFESLGNYIRSFMPDVLGITAFTYTFYDVLKAAKVAKSVSSNIYVCLGGPSGLLFPNETMSHPEIDSIVIGDGEVTFVNLLDHIASGTVKKNHIEGLIDKNSGEMRQTKNAPFIKHLDTLPFPAYDLLLSNAYKSTFGRAGKMASICSSRGCPYQCTFSQVLIKKYREHSVPYLIELMQQFYRDGYRNYYFFDDLFNISAERVMTLSEAILSGGMKISWIFRGRVNRMNKEMFKIAAKAGCCQILVGVEDYTDTGLKAIKKNITIEQVHQAIEWAHKYKIEVSTNWIIGLPSHKSSQDIMSLVKASISTGADYAQYTILQLLPGCEMFEEAVRDGVIHRERWSYFVRNPVPKYQIEAYEKYLSVKELSQLYKECHKRFYKRPKYIIGRLTKIRSVGELVKKVRVGLRMVG